MVIRIDAGTFQCFELIDAGDAVTGDEMNVLKFRLDRTCSFADVGEFFIV